MRTTDSRATFLNARLTVAVLLILLSFSLLPALHAAAAASQSPPKIPGFSGLGKPKAEAAPLFFDSRDQVDVTIKVASETVAPGGDLPVAVQFTLRPNWHIWPRAGALEPDGQGALAEFDGAIRTEILVKPMEDGTPREISGVFINRPFFQWPALHGAEADLGDGAQRYGVYEGSFAVFLPLSISANAPIGRVEIPLIVSFQACDDKGCSAPADVELLVSFEITATSAASGPSTAFANFDPSVYGRIRAGDAPSETIDFNLFSWTFSIDPSGSGFLLLLLIAALGGMLLNFTPCVLPIIPLKIMGLAQAAQGSRAKCFFLGCVMSLGVIAFWMALGVLMATVKGFTSANQLFQEPLFTIGVGVVIAVMAVGMAGLFSVQLPDWVYMFETKHDSYFGSFNFGIMTAVLSTPCTAPLMGTAVAWATTQGPDTILTVFATVGTGMALPYLVLSAFPHLVDSMPRTGPASDLIKQVMGLLLLAAAAFFIGAGLAGVMVTAPEPPNRMYWWVVALLGVAAGAWMFVRTISITKKMSRRIVFCGVGAGIFAISALIGISQTAEGPIDWTYYTPDRLADAQKDGKVVVVDFTAEWCANCKTFEALVLNLPSVAKELNADDVAAIKVDLTGKNPDGNALLKASNRVTIPLLLVYGRDGSLILNASDYTPQQVLDAITTARGK